MPSRTPELELKFSAAGPLNIGALVSRAGIASVAELPPLDLLAVYYDTDDLRLARAGITMRYRAGDEEGDFWTVKLPVTNGVGWRDEVRFPKDAGGLPEDARRLVTAHARGRGLVPVGTLRTKRRRWSLLDGDGNELAELVDDRVSVLKGERIKERFRELELEARSLDHGGLQRIADALASLGATPAPAVPKLVRALGPLAAEPSDLPEIHSVSPRSPVAAAIAAVLASAVQRLILYDPDARLGDPEGVHQMRVASRRLRGCLRTFSSMVEPAWAEVIIDELRWLARTLGEVRDLDVLLARLQESAADEKAALAPIMDELDKRRIKSRSTLSAALNSDRYIALLERLLVDANAPSVTEVASRSCRSALPRLVGETWQPLADAVKELEEGASDERYHEVRIQAKRTRYAAEVASGCLGRQASREALRFARQAEEVQNVLGTRQDCVVLRQALLEEAALRVEDGPFNLAAGRLVERQQQSIAECDKTFRNVWRTFNRKKNRDWLSG